MNQNYNTITGEVPIKTVQLEVERFRMRQNIDMHCLEKADIRTFVDEAARHFVIDFQARVASKKYEVKTVQFPATWKQAAKMAFCRWKRTPARLARWILRKWPVVMEEVTLEASAYYPDIEIPNHQAYVQIAMSVHKREWLS